MQKYIQNWPFSIATPQLNEAMNQSETHVQAQGLSTVTKVLFVRLDPADWTLK